MLFDFPPPIFELTVKGYYGNSITYKLHLVKYTSEFSAQNGNFIIDAQFVAVTFAPLADILFRYVINAPLINNEESMSPSTGIKPKNTYELIMKLKNLYAAIANKIATSTENKQYESVQAQIEAIDDISDMLVSVIKGNNEVLQKPGTPYLIIMSPKNGQDYNLAIEPALLTTENYNLQIVKNLSDYNDFIKAEETTGTKNTLGNRLYMAYLVGDNLPLTDDAYVAIAYTTENPAPVVMPFVNPTTKNYGGFKKALSTFSKSLTQSALPAFQIKTGDVATPEPFTNGVNVVNKDTIKTEYYGMDITEYYYKIYKKNQSLADEKTDLSKVLSEKINNMVSQQLGMSPTIYNIFEIILNDVDEFFSIVSKTSKEADTAHNISPDVIKTIASNNIDSPASKGNIPDHIYPFPLMIEQSTIHGGTKQERIAPITLSEEVPFPELDLVENFMDTFVLQRNTQALYDARSNQNDDGTFKWIPVSPLDSILGGASPESPYLNINDGVRATVTTTLLKRFYVLSQGSLFNTFYGEPSSVRNAYINLYANAEAVNIVTALISKQNAETLQLMADEFKRGGVSSFYEYAETLTTEYDDGTTSGKTGNLINFPTNDPKSFVVTPSQPYVGQAYVDKRNANFTGVNWYTKPVDLQGTPDEDDGNRDSTKPIDNFNSDAKTEWFQNGVAEELFYDFTEENVIYLKDIGPEDKNKYNVIVNGLSTFTRYLVNIGDGYAQTVGTDTARNSNFPGNNAIEGQKLAYSGGNREFEDFNKKAKKALKYGNNILSVWQDSLSDSAIVDTLTGDTNMSTILTLSNFGTTASPFNIYPNSLNDLIFSTPAAIEVPEFYAPYIGALLTAIDPSEGQTPWVNEILEYFTGTTGDNGTGRNLPNKGFCILADLHDVDAYLSIKDKATFKAAYDAYANQLHGTIINGISELVGYCRRNLQSEWGSDDGMFPSELQGYMYLLNPQFEVPSVMKKPIGHGEHFWIIQKLMERKSLINFSQITFEMDDVYPDGYTSIEELNANLPNASGANTKFFEQFFIRLSNEIFKKTTQLIEKEKALTKAKGDKDIINQLYYSFKNINDKWITGNENYTGEYPFNKKNKKLIDSFAFVDRGMNPIGDTVINAEILTDMFDDPNISLFSVLSQLLSLNGFEFFPLQNFMNFEKKGAWEDSFKIQTGAIDAVDSTAFVCMYIGGTSSYPSVSGNGFENDGIIDIAEPGVNDFFTTPPELNLGTVNDLQEEKNDEFPWRQVRAFRVRFGEQNQSMFTDIKIDSKEYPETNESIQILSRLAGDNNPDAPVPKGQNLYNLYENRSYKATVTGFGNAMIQPTQYFQLENIPLFNGAYIILTVEHNITANKMTTSFSGTKLLKYPVPRVLNPMAFTAYNPNQSSGDYPVAAANSADVNTHYNAMYDGTDNSLKIE